MIVSKIAYAQLDSAEFRMRVFVQRKSHIDRAVGEDGFCCYALGHAPGHRVKAHRSAVGLFDPQFHVLLLEHLGRQKDSKLTCDEDRFAVAHAEWLHALNGPDQFWIYPAEFDFRLRFKNRDQVFRSEIRARVRVETFPEFIDAIGGQRETHGVGMSAKAGKELVAAFEGTQKVKSGNGASGAVAFAVFAANDKRWAIGPLDNPRCRDANDSAMPAFAV